MAAPLDDLTMPLPKPVAQGLAQPGGVRDPVLRQLAGLPPLSGGGLPGVPPPQGGGGGGGGAIPDKGSIIRARPKKAQKAAQPNKTDPAWAGLVERFKSPDQFVDDQGVQHFPDAHSYSFGQEGNNLVMTGYLPSAAIRPAVRQMLAAQGLDVTAIDVSKIPPEQARYLQMILDPKWVAGQLNPGGALSEAEKADALKTPPAQ